MHEKKLKNSNRIDVPKEIYIKITIRKIGIKQNQATGSNKMQNNRARSEVIPTYKFALHSRIQLKIIVVIKFIQHMFRTYICNELLIAKGQGRLNFLNCLHKTSLTSWCIQSNFIMYRVKSVLGSFPYCMHHHAF